MLLTNSDPRESADHSTGEMMNPKGVLACPAGITPRTSRDASSPLQSWGLLWWLSLLLGYSSQALIPPECKITSCTLQRLVEMPRMLFGAHLPPTQQKHLRGAWVSPPKGKGTQHLSPGSGQSHTATHHPSHPGEKSCSSIFPAAFSLFCMKYFPEQPQRPEHPGDLYMGKCQPDLPPNEHEIWP